ncbi:hypothetical protein [Olleya sp. HaHaR_3_96]|uniref:hypothetical protein n=1 Tax=Olleya sp. HaHaR_3_96 TaxID=2745560 RepID=UPI001C4EE0D2|nr:hypothetical protein [Olleya sp. HaHaR_3_96]QXP60064.1 hypothetical protein H0I26_19510 [Olleya sp. HaHaR_3_96]
MNYISLIDELGIDINTLTTLDDAKIIRLQKQLKAKAVLDNKSNLGELATIIDELKNDNIRQHHIFIEKHKWIKQIISGEYSNIPQNSTSIYHEAIADPEGLKHFLSPYLKEHLKPFLSETLSKGKYILLLNVVKSNVLFTEEIEQIIINLFSSKLNYAKVYIETGKLKDKYHPLGYITNRNFITCLSQYPNSFYDEVNELNSVIIDTYNSKRKHLSDDIFIFSAKTMVAFGELDISNYMLKDVLISNAAIAQPYAFNSPKKSKSKSGSSVGIWSVIVFLILIVRITTKVFNNDNNTHNSLNQYERINLQNMKSDQERLIETIGEIQENKKNNTHIYKIKETSYGETEVEETILEPTDTNPNNVNHNITLQDYNSKYKAKDHTRFIYSLKLKTERYVSYEGGYNGTDLNAFTNPYPKTFNLLESGPSKNNTAFSLLKNNSNKDLIVFKLTNGIDESIFIPKDKNRYLNIKEGDSVLFYTGEYFLPTRFSHFTYTPGLSKLYVITNFKGTDTNEINILPYTVKIEFNKNFSTNNTTLDTTIIDHIETNKIHFNPLNIDSIYTKWYRKKYN